MCDLDSRKEKALRFFLDGMSITKASAKAKVGERTLSNLLKEKNIDTYRNSRKYYYDEGCFKVIDTQEKAYWLGFIYADGCIRENQGKNKENKGLGLEISLKESDKSHLAKFVDFIGCNDKTIVKRKLVKLKNKEYVSYRVVINSTKMCKDLIDKGAYPRKSLTLKFPNENVISKELLNHFLRGYFDGDGNIGLRNTQRYVNCPRISMEGTSEFLVDMKQYFEKELNVTEVKIYKKQSSKSYMYQKSGTDARSILRYMFDGANIYLDRKYEIIKQIIAV